MKGIVVRLFAIALLSMAARSAQAAGFTAEVDQVKDKALLASFDTFTNACSGIDSAIDVQWNSSLIKTTSTGTSTQATIVVTLHYVDTCSGDSLIMSGFSQTPNGTVSSDLSKGHVDAVIPISTDPDSVPVKTATLNLSLNFTATGPTATIRHTETSRGAAVITVNNFSISSRPATATGSASATLPLSTGAKFVNLIGTPSLSASIGKDAFGNITILKKK
jgi:hypothetical protein